MRIIRLAFLAAVSLAAQDTTDRKDIRELIEVSGGFAAIDQVFTGETIRHQLRTMLANAPAAQKPKIERFIEEFSQEFTKEARGQREHLVNLITEVYTKHYTPEDVKALIAFYKTPAGRKFATVGPKAMLESMEVGQKWGQELGEKIGTRVQKRLEAEEKLK